MRQLALAAAAVLASCLAGPCGAAAADNALVIGVAQFAASLNPYISSQTVQFYTVGFGTRPISAFDHEGKPACFLCSELPTLQNGLARIEDLGDGKRGLAVTIKLKPDLMWGDGVPVTAKDIAFTFRLSSNPAAGFSDIYPWTRARSVEVVDDHTAVLHLDRTLTTYQLWDYLLPEHIERAVYEQSGDPLDYINHTTYNAAPTTPGLWNGPYVISDYRSGEQVELRPNPYWKGKKPGLDRIVIRLIENTAALQANLLSGDVDMTPSGIGITTDQAVSLGRDHPGQFAFFYHQGLQMERIDLKRENPLLADLRVRQALLLAIDRTTLINRLFSGHASIALSWINALDPNFTPDVATYPYDPNRARALLKEAGFTPGADGICRNARGDRLSFEFSTTSGNRVRELSQQVMQNQWKAICVEATIRNEPSRSFFGVTMRQRTYTGFAEYGNSTRIGLVPTPFYGTAGIPSQQNNWNGMNVTAFSDPDMDRAMAAAEVELDPAKQKALWADIQRIYAVQLPELPLYFREDPDVVGSHMAERLCGQRQGGLRQLLGGGLAPLIGWRQPWMLAGFRRSRSWTRLSAVATMASSLERGAQPSMRRAFPLVAFLRLPRSGRTCLTSRSNTAESRSSQSGIFRVGTRFPAPPMRAFNTRTRSRAMMKSRAAVKRVNVHAALNRDHLDAHPDEKRHRDDARRAEAADQHIAVTIMAHAGHGSGSHMPSMAPTPPGAFTAVMALLNRIWCGGVSATWRTLIPPIALSPERRLDGRTSRGGAASFMRPSRGGSPPASRLLICIKWSFCTRDFFWRPMRSFDLPVCTPGRMPWFAGRCRWERHEVMMTVRKEREMTALPPAAGDVGGPALAAEKPRRRTKTREALLSAGCRLMAARPRDGFTIDDVVQSAGVGKGSFYNHFLDKDALADEIYRTIRAKEESEIEAVNGVIQEPAVRIAQAMAVYARFALTLPDEARIMTRGQVDALSIDSSTNAGLVRDIAEGLRTGKVVTPSIEVAALLVIGQTAVLMSRLQTAGREAAASLAQQCIALTLLGLGLEHRAAHLVSAQAVEEVVRGSGRDTLRISE